MDNFKIPIAIFFYNRPNLLKQLWAVIEKVRPSHLLLVADGARNDEDEKKVEACRAIVSDIHWPCKVQQLYRNHNLGVGPSVAKGLDWVFSQVDYAIILEDDLIPHLDFFPFMEQMLLKYENKADIFQVCGTNLLDQVALDGHYFYSRHVLLPWGWGSWARAWAHYDFNLKWWAREQSIVAERIKENIDFWHPIFDFTAHSPSSWDIQWAATTWRYGGQSIIPQKNLVKNLGFGPDATFTNKASSTFKNKPYYNLGKGPYISSENYDAKQLNSMLEAQIQLLIQEVIAGFK